MLLWKQIAHMALPKFCTACFFVLFFLEGHNGVGKFTLLQIAFLMASFADMVLFWGLKIPYVLSFVFMITEKGVYRY